jgi:hypothetical protein
MPWQMAIADFVSALCKVSVEEVSSAPPRTFSLQKLVEVASCNMDRIRFVWSRVWSIIGKHFMRVGRDQNLSISMTAVDSLRQLMKKFLEQPELANFQFQKDFIRPFESLMILNPHVQLRELVRLLCLLLWPGVSCHQKLLHCLLADCSLPCPDRSGPRREHQVWLAQSVRCVRHCSL